MSARLNIALPGYNALTDTNPDHFSLKTDEDNVLIKEFLRSQDNIAGGGNKVFAHNFNYIPFFLSFGYQAVGLDGAGDFYKQVDHNAFDVDYAAYTDLNNLRIDNLIGDTMPFTTYLFYDAFTSGNPSFSQSNGLLKVTKSGYNALTDTNPNHYIFHSDLNTFKIIKENLLTLNITSGGGWQTVAHGLGLSNPHAFMAFIQFPDGSITRIPSNVDNVSRDGVTSAGGLFLDETNFYIFIQGSGNFTVKIKYYFFETPLVGSTGKEITLSDHKLRIAKSGYNALTDIDSNHYNFLSGFNTLKYFDDGSEQLTITGDGSLKTATASVYHGLGYTPLFACFTNDNGGASSITNYNNIPFNFSGISYTNFASCWCDDNYLYFKLIYNSTETIIQNFYYKIFKNNLGF